MSERAERAVKASDPNANARRPSESATLVCAAAAAVALGVACGFWINSRLASSASARRPAPLFLVRHDARAQASPPADETTTLQAAVEKAFVEEPAAAVVESRTPRPAAREASRQAKADSGAEVRKRGEPEREKARPGPCALYASASSLIMRGGGAAFLVVGGPGEAGSVNVSTPSWADIAVFREGPAAGGNGWVRYMVKSVGKRPGLYALHFSTRCGSQTIPVTVK